MRTEMIFEIMCDTTSDAQKTELFVFRINIS